MKHNNSDYKKTFYYEQLIENNIIAASLINPNSLKDYLENLIFDVIKKRNLNEKRIIFITDNLWTKHLLQSLLLCNKIIDKQNNILNTTNQISIVEITNDFDNLIYKANAGNISFNINDSICEADTIIFIDFDVLMNDYNELLEQLRNHWKKLLWIGIGVNNEKYRDRHIGIGDELIDYLPDTPITFEGFVNKDLLEGIDSILNSLSHNNDVGIFAKQLNCDIFINENDESILEIGTSEYFEDDSEDEKEEAEERPFYILIKINRYGLELKIDIQDYNFDGHAIFRYEMSFEDDIWEEYSKTKVPILSENNL